MIDMAIGGRGAGVAKAAAPFGGRGAIRTALACALAWAAAMACSSDEVDFNPLSPAGQPREVAVTLTQCDCDTCRLTLSNPEDGSIFFNSTDPPVGVALTASSCYDGEAVRVSLECGNCSTGSACTASVAVQAGGVALIGGPATCTTQPEPGADCQFQASLDVDPAAPTVSCFP
ncbi:MAG: hypothetical protein ACE5JH_04440 [Acidobacteriota bacterium]